MRLKIYLVSLLVCVAFMSAGEIVYASAPPAAAGITPSAAALTALAAGEPLVETVTVFPGLAHSTAPADLRLLSASASVKLAWMLEGERRRYFSQEEPDSILVEVESLLRLGLSSTAETTLELGLPEPEFGQLLGLAVSASLEGGQWEVLAVSGTAGAQRAGKSLELKLKSGQVRDLKIRFYSFLHRQQNPPVKARRQLKSGWLSRAGLWGRARRGAGKASYFPLWNCSGLGTFQAAAGGRLNMNLDLGRAVSSRWIKLSPLNLKPLKKQRVLFSASLKEPPDLSAVISDSVLTHYPPMSLKQKEDSRELVERAARECGRP